MVDGVVQVALVLVPGLIPGLVTRLETRILSVGMRRPTLDDVFLKLTGREIREETGADSDLGKPWKMRPIAARGGRIR